ncbi:MAG: helix-turn-helix transcriptional regulator [Bacteroidales bacterium]|nr:helix-turn-helix transcriptional regulator [Bacteroidales bacterium]
MKKRIVPNTFGSRVRLRRLELSMSQKEVAAEAGISKQFLYNLEHNRQNIRTDNLIKLAAALEVSTDYLLLGRANSSDAQYLTDIIKRLGCKEYANLRTIIERYCDSYAAADES